MTEFKIIERKNLTTIISELWNGKQIRKYNVCAKYNGGDIMEFIECHDHHCFVNWHNLQEYLSDTMFLDNLLKKE